MSQDLVLKVIIKIILAAMASTTEENQQSSMINFNPQFSPPQAAAQLITNHELLIMNHHATADSLSRIMNHKS